MTFLKFLLFMFTLFGLMYLGLKTGYEDDWGLKGYSFFWLFYVIINIAMIIWRIQDDQMHFDGKKTLKYLKICPYCMKKLPSYFSSKCPYCTADL
jgi:hypothetical protein